MIRFPTPRRANHVARAAALFCASLAAVISAPATASSHREAPFITTVPKVDGTDFYMFMSYEAGRSGW
jgi:Domain of unknown function (DUF4331)